MRREMPMLSFCHCDWVLAVEPPNRPGNQLTSFQKTNSQFAASEKYQGKSARKRDALVDGEAFARAEQIWEEG
jgi:hypothetical protein